MNGISIIRDTLKKALSVRKHPGISSDLSGLRLAMQGVPYLTSREGGAKPPLTIYWNVNSVCNLHCKMCDVGTFNEASNFFKILRIDRKLHEISLDRFKSVVDEVAPFGSVMSINGTEPLMYKPLGKAIAYARRAGLKVAVTTGGYNLPQKASELAEAGLSRLNVSLDGPPGIHNKIRGRPDSFERATDGIAKFKEAAKRQGLNAEVLAAFTISNLNCAYLDEFIDSLASFPVDRINFCYMTYVTKNMAALHNNTWKDKYSVTEMCVNEEVSPDQVDVDLLYKQIQLVKARKDRRIVFLPDYSYEQLTKFFRSEEFMGNTSCMSSWYFIQIQADGELMPFTRCYRVHLGNINSQSFMDIWNGEKAKAWRRDLKREKRFPACARCSLVI